MARKTVTLIAVLFLCSTALADRPLERSEILELFTTLTANPQKAWISTGTIQATRREYRAARTTDTSQINVRIAQEFQEYIDNPNKSELTFELQQMKIEAIPFNVRYELTNAYTMDSAVTIKVDGEKFHWQIDVNSRTDSVKPTADLADNYMTEEFNLDWNEKRVFAWDGNSYVTYFRPGNHATIEPKRFPVNGPLTAGVIPWGHGKYSLEELTNAESSATEKGTEIHLTLARDTVQETFVLDTEKDYALKQYSIIKQDGKRRLCNYTYQSVDAKWLPQSVVIEKYDTDNRLLARDAWEYTSISFSTPDDFAVQYEYDTFIEDFSLGGDGPLQYRYSAPELPPMGGLIEQRLMFANAHNQNCATASLKYVFEKLGVNQSYDNLSQIVNDGNTTLSQMQQFVEEAGFESIAITADIETLRSLDNYQVILHLPEQNHFVVLHDIDDEYIRLVDLSSNKFFYRKNIGCYGNTTALLIAKQPIQEDFAKIDNTEEIIGCCGESCTELLQQYAEWPCVMTNCSCKTLTTYVIQYTRYGCEDAPSGSCNTSQMLDYKTSLCEEPLFEDCECNPDGEWTSHYMQACD